MKIGLASSAGSDVPREIAWYADVRRFDPTAWQHSFIGIGYEIISSAILPLLLFRVGLVVIYCPKDVHYVLVYCLGIMHLSFVTTAIAPIRLENSGDIDFPLCKAQVYVQQCRNISMVKVLLKSRQAILKLARPVLA